MKVGAPFDLSKLSYRVESRAESTTRNSKFVSYRIHSVSHTDQGCTCTWNSSWIETRNALLSRRQPILRFEVDTSSIFEFSRNRNSKSWSRTLQAEALEDYWIFFFSLNKIIFILQFYHNFQNSPLPFDKFIIRWI